MSVAQGTLPLSQLEEVSKLVLGIHCLYTAVTAAGRSRETRITQSVGDTGSPLREVLCDGSAFSGQIWGLFHPGAAPACFQLSSHSPPLHGGFFCLSDGFYEPKEGE